MFKVALPFQINKFHKKSILRIWHTYNLLNISNRESVLSFEEKTIQPWFIVDEY